MGEWQRTRLKHLAAIPITTGVGLPAEHQNPDWPRYIRTTDIAGPQALRDDVFYSQPPELLEVAGVQSGDLLMTAAGSVGQSYLHTSSDAAVYAGYLARFRPRPDVDPRFIAYWAQSTDFWRQIEVGAVRSTIDNFSAGRYRNLELIVPSPDVQIRIADFLDRETQRIDDALALLGGLEDLLAERFAGNIEDMLAPKPGSQRMRIDWVCDVLREQVSLEEIQQLDEVVLYSVDGVAATGSPVRTRGSEIESAKLRVHGGELLVSRLNPRRGHVTTTSTHDQVSLCSGEWVVLRPRSGFALEYLYFLFSSDSTRQRLDSLVRSVTKSHGRVDPSEVTKMWVTIPSAEVQLDISETLSRADRQRTEVSSLLERQRQLLAERRLALVSAAVTDQLDVEAVA